MLNQAIIVSVLDWCMA